MLIVIVRHGETLENRNRIIQGHMPGRLTEIGRRQSRDLGLRLREYGQFDQIISSDLDRARETATLIAKEMAPCEIILEGQLRERHYGDLEGKHVCRLKRLLVENKRDVRGLTIPDGEPYADFELRVTNCYNRFIEGGAYQKILLVTHSGVMRVILEKILGSISWDIGNCRGFQISSVDNLNTEVEKL
ncbi:MAG TPA: histidine phosphatase family protein [Thermodesulfovibrionales bacterium]|nr:histidine phosphatase family protein [Thermodesulfovibrionales bacterium]